MREEVAEDRYGGGWFAVATPEGKSRKERKMVLGPFIAYQGSWIRLNTSKYFEEVMLPYVEEDMLLKWVFQQDNDPKQTSKQQHLGSSPNLDPTETLLGDTKNAASEAKPRHAEELWNMIQSYLFTGARSWSTPWTQMWKREKEVLQLNISSGIHSKNQSSSRIWKAKTFLFLTAYIFLFFFTILFFTFICKSVQLTIHQCSNSGK